MNLIIKVVVGVSKFIAAFTIAAGVFLAFVNVVARYIFESSLTWASELTIYLFLWSTFFGAVYCFKKDAHINIDLLLVKVSPKTAKFLMLISYIIILMYLLAIAYYGYEYVLLYIELGEVSIDLDIPLWIPYSAVPISFALAALVVFYKIITLLKTPSEKFHIKDEVQEVLEEFEIKQMLKEVEKKTGGML